MQLFLLWIGTVLLCGLGHWIAALLGEHGLREAESPIGTDLAGLGDARYFSIVTATAVGYGDIVPVGCARGIAVTEAVTELLIFGAVVAKFVSHRRDELVHEIHQSTFDERLDRVQANPHAVIAELLSIKAACETGATPPQRLARQLENALQLTIRLASRRTSSSMTSAAACDYGGSAAMWA